MTVFAASVVEARKLGIDFRVDYKSTDYSTAASDVGRDNQRYYLQIARLNYVDNLSESITARLRWRISGKNQGNVTKRDSTNSNLDLAYLNVVMNPKWTLQFGKVLSDIGGFEGAIPGHDIYFLSEGNAGTWHLNAGTQLAGADTDVYYTGAKLTWNATDKTNLTLHSANTNTAVGRNATSNSPGDKTDGGFLAQTRLMSGLVLKSKLTDEWETLASFHYTEPGAGTVKAMYSALGFQWTNPEWIYQIDFISNDYTSRPAATNLQDSLRSVTHSLRKKWSQSHLIFRQHYSEEVLAQASGSDSKNKYTGAGLAYEYFSSEFPALRYHVAGQWRQMDPQSGGNRELVEIFAGFKMSTDLFQGF